MLAATKIDFARIAPFFDKSRFTWFQISFIFGGSALAIWKLSQCMATWKRHSKIRSLIRKRQKEREDAVRKVKLNLASSDPKVLEKRKWIISLPVKELTAKLQNEELTPLDVLEAFQSAALVAHERTNCITQFIVEARDWCIQLQQQYEGRGDKPPLFGLPFSVKESIGVKGYDSTGGLSRFLFDPMKEDGVLVNRLRQLGAIPFVLTNVPQTLLAYNCSNPIYGTTKNAKNPKRTCGGSSGGEGALLAFRGSVFGIGSDLAGSVRIPAHFNGVASLKPSSLRLSQMGGRLIIPGRSAVASCFGPLACDVDTLVLFMREVLQEKFFGMDTYTVPIPFRDDLYESDRKLTIGYYDFDGFMEAIPACRRAVAMAKEILEKRGHRLVRFSPPNIEKLFPYLSKVLFIDGGQYLYHIIRNDVLDPNMVESARWLSLPLWYRKLIAKTALFFGHSKLGALLGAFDIKTRDLGASIAVTRDYKNRFNAEWARLNLDAVICPPCATVAMPPEYPTKTIPAYIYTSLYNLVDYPAGIVPVTHVTVEDERNASSTYKANEFYAKLVLECSKEGTVGLPVGVQCVASTYNEEICLKVMKEVEEGVGKMNYM